MKQLDEDTRQEVLKSYETYWESYLIGDIENLSEIIGDSYKTFGTAQNEVFDNKADALHSIQSSLDQFVGKVKLINREIDLMPYETLVLVTEQADLYVLIGDEWSFYSPFRSSVLLKKNQGSWKVVHQHASFPDARTEKDEIISIESIKEENIALKEAVKRRTKELEQSFADLKELQDQLVQQEKLASLGQLTAGIAHEIKNPLNFVNNFSELSLELLEEAREAIEPSDSGSKDAELASILDDIEDNLRKIHEHGNRADRIVKSMLQHSRGSKGTKQPTDLNALIEEYLNLSFHGMRAGNNPINVDLNTELDRSIGEIEINPEDISRVLINLFNNAFDAMSEKLEEQKDYQPQLTVRTYCDDGQVVIEVEDNGPGIPKEIREDIMQPFFTTKKGTAGTGLGLSITHDIIKSHGGNIEIESDENSYTKFNISIPTNN